MSWKIIGRSIVGTSHTASGKPCEDALKYDVLTNNGEDHLMCCAADGAGSALYGGYAALQVVTATVAEMMLVAKSGQRLELADLLCMLERRYDELNAEARRQGAVLNEFSCTMLGAYVAPDYAVFFHVGDGAIIRNDGSEYYLPVWWPDNGEYQNTTHFLIDDANLSSVRMLLINETINEIALMTDGLQNLSLNIENQSVHQPFFESLFRYLRRADSKEKIEILDTKLGAYLAGSLINERTDDDKTLLLATRL